MPFDDSEESWSNEQGQCGTISLQYPSVGRRQHDHCDSNQPGQLTLTHTGAGKERFTQAFALQAPDEPSARDILRREFDRVVVPHLEAARALARALAGNRFDAEDIVQDASLSAYRGIMNYASGDARTWVLTIVRRAAYQWLRKNRRSVVVHLDDIEQIEETLAFSEEWQAGTPEAALIAKADAERVQAAMGAIPPPYQETLLLREVRGLDYREIAMVTGVPIGTVMSRLARARRRLTAEVNAREQ